MDTQLVAAALAGALIMAIPACAGTNDDTGTGSSAGTQEKEQQMALTLTSSAFQASESIPRKYTCDGDDISPPLSWSNLPEGTRSLALIMDDPDAPDPAAPKMTWVHWVLYDIPAGATGLPENTALSGLPGGTREGLNNWDRTGYGGPCPPKGSHRYFHKLYALDTTLGDLDQPTKDQLLEAMEGHVLEQAELIGTYERGR